MIEIDSTSLLVTTDTDETIAQLEEQVLKEGFTLNYFTPPDNQDCLADALEERLPNLYGEAFGGIEELCAQVRWIHPSGEEYFNKLTPRSATGPSLKKFSIGSDQLLGTPIQATFRLFPRPRYHQYAIFSFPSTRASSSFKQWVYKGRLAIPLFVEISPSKVEDFLEKEKVNESFIGAAFWGEEKLVLAMINTLSESAHQKKGRHLEIGKKNQPEFLDMLRKTKESQLKKERKFSAAKEKGLQGLRQMLQRCS